MEFVLVALVLLTLLALGIPIYVALGLLSVGLFILEDSPLIGLSQIYVENLNSATLIAIPFFVISATFMQRGGIARALVDWANTWVGSYRGGACHCLRYGNHNIFRHLWVIGCHSCCHGLDFSTPYVRTKI